MTYPIRFYGRVDPIPNTDRAVWSGGMECLAVAYDTPIPGYGTKNCANIRLWSAKPVQGFDLNSFNGKLLYSITLLEMVTGRLMCHIAGNYEASVAASSEVENIVCRKHCFPCQHVRTNNILRPGYFIPMTTCTLVRSFE